MKRLITSSTVLILLLSISLSLKAQEYTFTHLGGPMGGSVSHFAMNSEGHIYAGLYDNFTQVNGSYGLHRSTDNGKTWEEVYIGIEYVDVYSIYITPEDHIYVGTHFQGMHRSTDNGLTWEEIGNGFLFGSVWDITQNAEGHFYIVDRLSGWMSRSTDGGNTWENNDRNYGYIIKMAPDSTMYICSYTGLLKSTDGGNTFTNVLAYNTSNIHFRNNSEYYVTTGYSGPDRGIFYSSDAGETWSEIGPYGYTLYDVTTDAEGTIYTATGTNGVMVSTDNGNNWESRNTNLYAYSTFRLLFQEELLFVGTEKEGVYRSEDNGKYWEQVGIPVGQVIDIEYLDSLIFTGTWAGVQKYNINTKKWRNLGLNSVIAIDVSEEGKILASSNSGLYYSENLGEDWQLVAFANQFVWDAILVNDTVFCVSVLGNEGTRIVSSTDSGTHWNVLGFPGSIDGTGLASTNDSTIYYNSKHPDGGSGIVKTTDFGRTIDTLYHGNFDYFNNTAAFYFVNDSLFSVPNSFVSHGPAVLTTDGGANWLEFDFPMLMMYVEKNGFFLGISSNSIYYSNDFGINTYVTEFPEKIEGWLQNITKHNGQLYAGTLLEGLYRLDVNTSIDEKGNTEKRPADYTTSQNYPNPFNPATTISFSLPEYSDVNLSVFNVLGEEVAELVNGTMEAGSHEIRFDASALPSGIYFYRLQAGTFSETRKMLLLR